MAAERRCTQLRDQARQLLGGSRRKLRFLGQPGTMRRVLSQRLHERLIRRNVLLVGTSIEHDSAVGMRTRGNPCSQARLADSRLAGQRHTRPHGRTTRAPRARDTRRSGAARPTNGRDSSRASTGGSGTGRCDGARAGSRRSAAQRLPGSAPRSDRASATRSRSCRPRTLVSSPSRCETRALIPICLSYPSRVASARCPNVHRCVCVRPTRVPRRRGSRIVGIHEGGRMRRLSLRSLFLIGLLLMFTAGRRARRGPSVCRVVRSAAGADDGVRSLQRERLCGRADALRRRGDP